jgi:hypothetical protein
MVIEKERREYSRLFDPLLFVDKRDFWIIFRLDNYDEFFKTKTASASM